MSRQITDRAKRYRAQQNAPPGPKRCYYCGNPNVRVEVEHIDGDEGNNSPDNLIWACRPCNTEKGNHFARVGAGKRTAQYNPIIGRGKLVKISESKSRPDSERLYKALQAARIPVDWFGGTHGFILRVGAMDQQVAEQIIAQVRGNPASAAAALSEAWHGRPARKETEHTETLHTHEYLTDLGGMELLEIARPKVNIRFGHDVRLASNEDGTQLYLVDGDQSIDLTLFKHVDPSKEAVILGPVQAITYHTAKQHLAEEDKTPGAYCHEFGEEGGELPLLVYDTINQKLSFAGGSYKIEKDMEGAYSAGLRD